jgi:putative endonuclease
MTGGLVGGIGFLLVGRGYRMGIPYCVRNDSSVQWKCKREKDGECQNYSYIYNKTINVRFMQKIHIYYVYMLSNTYNNVLYTGVTNNLVRRCYEHKTGIDNGFTKKYNVHKLVYYEIFDYIESAIAREKQIKGYSRAKKDLLINGFNPQWVDLYNDGKIMNDACN